MLNLTPVTPNTAWSYLTKRSSKDAVIATSDNQMEVVRWTGDLKKTLRHMGVAETYSKIAAMLLNNLLQDNRVKEADSLLSHLTTPFSQGSFKGIPPLMCLIAVEKKLPAISHDHIAKELADCLRPHILSYSTERTLRVLQITVEELTARHLGNDPATIMAGVIESSGASESNGDKKAPVELSTGKECKVNGAGLLSKGAEFVVMAEMFTTKPGTNDYKKRIEEGRKYFATAKHLDAAIDFITSRVKFPYSFVVKHVTAEELAKAYASSPEHVKIENAAFGLLHRLSVLFLNTMDPGSEEVANAAMNYALRASWERSVVENNTQQTEQQEILARMNLKRAGELTG